MSLTDVLIGIAYYLPKEERTFRYDYRKFHGFFQNRKRDFPNFFEEIRFEDDGTSPDVYDSLTNLLTSGILCTSLNHMFKYDFDGDCVDYYFSKNMQKLPDNIKQDLERLANEFSFAMK